VLREALSRLLSEDDDDGYLIHQLVVEDMEPAQRQRRLRAPR
jgi:hypothetical protein